ncbi:TIGR02710 family CRISPR-associated CARF protein [uncultured Methanobrevibacter sp.]|uniref:TIGR02710 family CRISPR-associated CARF protein n=1 Tax=uncultured Methanobrevibacter sp. TaxID=253161 RepID=UPI0025F3D140|nr:TIGR02710 family CRISPR-associated CARF protein [uncultured Methanobrevibacter sp.]
MSKKKKALILTTGGTVEPLVEAIKKLNPDYISFVHSEDTEKIALEVSSLFSHKYLSNEMEFYNIDDPQEMHLVYNKVKEIISDLNSRDFDIYLDFTGGTKSMVAGAILATIGNNIEYSYIGSDSIFGRDKNGVGIVKTGHENFKPQEDPFELYAVEEIKNSKQFFNLHQFQAAIENLKIAKSKIQDDELNDEVKFYRSIVEFYDDWDKFKPMKFSRLSRNLKYYPHIVEKLNKVHPGFISQIHNNIQFLNQKYSADLSIEDRIIYYLPDLLNNAARRIEEGKYDDAVARLYRANELIAQISLTNVGILDHNLLDQANEFKINKGQLISIMGMESPAVKFVNDNDPYDFDDPNKCTVKLPSYNSFQLLKKIEYELNLSSNIGVEYERRNINNNVKSRNTSILAHGLNPISPNKANKLFDLILDFSKILMPNIEEEMEFAKFPKFTQIN